MYAGNASPLACPTGAGRGVTKTGGLRLGNSRLPGGGRSDWPVSLSLAVQAEACLEQLGSEALQGPLIKVQAEQSTRQSPAARGHGCCVINPFLGEGCVGLRKSGGEQRERLCLFKPSFLAVGGGAGLFANLPSCLFPSPEPFQWWMVIPALEAVSYGVRLRDLRARV